MLQRLNRRNLVPELMDAPDLNPAEHLRALAGLRRVNFLSRTSITLAKHISDVARGLPRIDVLDVGCGGGDVAAGVFQRLRGKGRVCRLEGWDISSTAVEQANSKYARQVGSSSIGFRVQDALLQNVGGVEQFDVVYCSLFLHHFDEPMARQLLQSLCHRARLAVVLDDLQRSRLGLCLATVGCQLLSRSPVVHFDGPQSVRAAFRSEEAAALLRDAGAAQVDVFHHWPQRFTLVGRLRPPNEPRAP